MKFSELNEKEKKISNAIEGIFINNPTISRFEFSRALAFLLNKYLIRKKK